MPSRWWLIAAAALVVVGLEAAARIFSPYVADSDEVTARLSRFTASSGRRLIPNTRVVIRNHRLSRMDVPIRTNSLGFRGEEVEMPKPGGELRILALGDSITWGDYLLEQDVWTSRLEQRLREAGENARVLNAGVGDIGIREEIDILRSPGISTEPDVVILAFYLNDSRPPWGFPLELGARGWLRRHSVLADQIHQRLALYRWLQTEGAGRFDWVEARHQLDWRADPAAFARLADLARFDWGAAWQEDSWGVIEESLNELAALAKQRGFEVVVALFPVFFQVYADVVDRLPQDRMEALARAHGFEVVDLLPLLRANRDRRVFYDACHPLPWANDLIAAELAAVVARRFGDAPESRPSANAAPPAAAATADPDGADHHQGRSTQ